MRSFVKLYMVSFLLFSFTRVKLVFIYLLKLPHVRVIFYTGFSFEAGDRTFCPVVCYSTSGTLRSILAIFFITVLYIFLAKASHEHTD